MLAAVSGVVVVARRREPRRGFIGEERAGSREQVETHRHRRHDAPSENEARRAEERERRGDHDHPTPDATPLGTPGPESAEAMTVVTRAAVRVVTPVLIVAGLYLVAWGYSPGGGFPGGAVLLGVALFGYVALGYRRD